VPLERKLQFRNINAFLCNLTPAYWRRRAGQKGEKAILFLPAGNSFPAQKWTSMKCNIRELRKKNNLTQRQLAVSMNVSESRISIWELGKETPTLENAFKLAHILNCLVDDLYTYSG